MFEYQFRRVRNVLGVCVTVGPALVALLAGHLVVAGTGGLLILVLGSLGFVKTTRAQRREPVSYVVDGSVVTVNWRSGSRSFDLASLEVERDYWASPFLAPAVRVVAGDTSFLVFEDLWGFKEFLAILERGSGASPPPDVPRRRRRRWFHLR